MNAPKSYTPYRPVPLARIAFPGAWISLPAALTTSCGSPHYYVQGHVDVIISDSPFPVTPDPAWFSKDANR